MEPINTTSTENFSYWHRLTCANYGSQPALWLTARQMVLRELIKRSKKIPEALPNERPAIGDPGRIRKELMRQYLLLSGFIP